MLPRQMMNIAYMIFVRMVLIHHHILPPVSDKILDVEILVALETLVLYSM
jgi:hypothetical protein